jgi:hypothetical protein
MNFFEVIDGELKLKTENTIEEHHQVIHDVKSWSHFFQAIKSGAKVHDLRKNDRNYNIGDIMLFREYDFVGGKYTGNTLEAVITYITDNRVPCAFSSAVLSEGYCILSLRVRR